ncbi:MAG: NAD(P)H-dependent oxidoreductase subunit E [Armatimonadetes bacterium]|nr:NAD(P)H-dependent oxidoreductase subunit E [Armatimonadota bacterium]
MDSDLVEAIVARHRGHPAALLAVLQDLQEELHWLPREALLGVADCLEVPLTRVYRVASFYRALSLEPRGEHLVRVCTGTACHLRGAPSIIDALQRDLTISPGETTGDMKFSLETVNCLGACALAPVITIDGKYFGGVKPGEVSDILDLYRDGR